MMIRTVLLMALCLGLLAGKGRAEQALGASSDSDTQTEQKKHNNTLSWLVDIPVSEFYSPYQEHLELQDSSKPRLLSYRDELLKNLDRHAPFQLESIPLMLQLSAVFKHSQDLKQATDYLSRAQHILHRHKGAHTAEQIPLVYAEAELMEQSGDLRQSEQLYRFAVKLNENNYGAESEQTIQAMNVAANWLRNHGNYYQAISLYNDAMKRSRKRYGKDSPEMINLMKNYAFHYLLYGGSQSSRGLRLHQRIAGIVKNHPDEMPLLDRVGLMLQIGDWSLLYGRRREALRHYQQAWNLSREDPIKQAEWDLYFSQPHPILPPQKFVPQHTGEAPFFDLVYQVNKQGRPKKIEVKQTNLERRLMLRVVSSLKQSLYRPALPNGKPIVARNISLSFDIPKRDLEGLSTSVN